MSDHANNMIDDLINTLNKLLENNDPLAMIIKNHALLIEGLTELRNMIEMDKIKLSMVEQVKLLITNKSRNYINDGHMMHSCVSGKAGQGKTTVARILAKIWISLDMIKKPTKPIVNKSYTESLEKLVIHYDYKFNKIVKQLNTQQSIIGELRTYTTELNKNNKKLKSISRDLRFNNDQLINIAN